MVIDANALAYHLATHDPLISCGDLQRYVDTIKQYLQDKIKKFGLDVVFFFDGSTPDHKHQSKRGDSHLERLRNMMGLLKEHDHPSP
ncbi:hypothetical protein SAMD00019534_036470 [Acytostelium subglobosum LB1]|uniref:hypothetical protein n=1 Tax=Acytostelium subglobosum LB1 TaxID=1410327 RepID=UPI0006449886|nr:hypothetical protein SAMD00019534_036470 [Acytostelium subglobosum LB1]GAM20472.1 hypothetical protein SAMD00019534_036470 [Acytostelium subglobosum LB1]|eukprot:XP_012759993.1 hypothetical protein SAMD00019534_036470 [Acytostelium subglobosum LB1]